MQRKLCALVAVGGALALAVPATAAADQTLGTTTPPTGAGVTPISCSAGLLSGTFAVLAQVSSDPATPYTVPAPGGQLTQWQTDATGNPSAGPLTFLVLRPAGGGSYTVVASDTETVPASSGVATFTLSTPIAVQAGDVLALEVTSTSETGTCGFTTATSPTSSAIPPDDRVGTSLSSSPASPGSAIPALVPIPASLLNVAANFVPSTEDAAVTTSATTGADAGHPTLLSANVTNNGPGAGAPITFTDSVPSGMKIDAVSAGSSPCSSSGQTVTCTISGLAAGQSQAVNVVVTPSSPGSYTNNVSVAVPSGVTDPNASNNSASPTLSVGLSLPAKCVVPKLKRVPSGIAKTVLKDLGCTVKTRKVHSKSVKKGLVVKTKPGRGTYAYQRKVTLVVSSGAPKKRHKHHRHHK